MFGQQRAGLEANAPYDIEIIAEINDAPRTPIKSLQAQARQLSEAGADVIDLGCDPTTDRPAWQGVGDAVRALREIGQRVSVDSFHVQEVMAACAAGAELVLSVNSTNVKAAADFGAAVVATPDTPQDLSSLDRTIERLQKMEVDFRVDPIVEPIGFGFAASLGRYIQVRRRHTQVPMMMGIGNLTEMTGVDSAGVNALLVGFCQELNIGSVLTTQVINWARSSVREIDLARRLMRFAVSEGTVPKHLDDRLVMLRDPKVLGPGDLDLKELAARLTDANVRIFTDAHSGLIHAMNKHVHAADTDPYKVFDELGVQDPSHAFYLGYEMAKALTAITLGKNYVQDEALNWGFLTRPEASHYERRKAAPRRTVADPGKDGDRAIP
jgi:dihydropteroate synthase-like protein